mgnify:CR=1 FL=1
MGNVPLRSEEEAQRMIRVYLDRLADSHKCRTSQEFEAVLCDRRVNDEINIRLNELIASMEHCPYIGPGGVDCPILRVWSVCRLVDSETRAKVLSFPDA